MQFSLESPLENRVTCRKGSWCYLLTTYRHEPVTWQAFHPVCRGTHCYISIPYLAVSYKNFTPRRKELPVLTVFSSDFYFNEIVNIGSNVEALNSLPAALGFS